MRENINDIFRGAIKAGLPPQEAVKIIRRLATWIETAKTSGDYCLGSDGGSVWMESASSTVADVANDVSRCADDIELLPDGDVDTIPPAATEDTKP